jgi:hypothetical protein
LESRAELRGTGISKWLIALFAVIAVLGLGVMAGYLAHSVSAPAATHTSSTDSTGVSNDEPGAFYDGSGNGFVP